MKSQYASILTAAALASACGGGAEASGRSRATETGRSRTLETANAQAGDEGRCDANQPGREVAQYDTSGDEVPDVRKVFRTIGEGGNLRLVLLCRESDLNGDGRKDVVRFYNDEGRPLREESDRNFDGTMDAVTFFERGRVVRHESDSNADGRVDIKVFYEAGAPIRTERDTHARSTASEWRPDRWEYFEEGRLIRVGSDIDGDGRVDRWDRDEELARARQAAAEAEATQQGAAATEGGTEGEGGTTQGEGGGATGEGGGTAPSGG